MTDPLDIARKALARLSQGIDCGCMPCMGQCWDKDSLRSEIWERCEVVRVALDAIGKTPASAIQCDEPLDPFTRATRDMARAA